jgi:uncharacterized membrane-anchored protein
MNVLRKAANVPAVTLEFWVLKIAATTLGETGGDFLSMSLGLGYLVSTGFFTVLFLASVMVQLQANRFKPWVYWATIVATTTVGTTLADFTDRSLGIGYAGGSSLLVGLLLMSLLVWHLTCGSIAVGDVNTPQAEFFYWLTILFSQTLGTALGDWMADTAGLGYGGAAVVFAFCLVMIAAAYHWTTISSTLLFWSAFILTRPLGAVVGDFLDKPLTSGGLALGRLPASMVLIVFMLVCMIFFKQRPASSPH